MKLGLIARAEQRGLGVMTQEFARHMNPDRVLLIDPGPLGRGFKVHADRYPDATVVRWNGGDDLDEATVRGWLDGLDAVYSAETFYDWRIIGWAADQRVATVLHAMPEFYRHDCPAPTAVWAPTVWRWQHLAVDTWLLPVPVPDDRIRPPEPTPDLIRVVHVAGHRAAHDRNGTLVLFDGLRKATPGRFTVRIECQDARLPISRSRVDVTRHLSGRSDRWSLYDDADVLVLPRRYGGLSLPANEAAACGLGLVMSDAAPNVDEWPIIPIAGRSPTTFRTANGDVALWEPLRGEVTRVLDGLTPEAVDKAKAKAHEWALGRAWSVWRPMYEKALTAAVEMIR